MTHATVTLWGLRVGLVVWDDTLHRARFQYDGAFTHSGLEVAPVRGNAVFFSYNRPDPGTMTLHGGAPVFEGEKWVATKWMRERIFE